MTQLDAIRNLPPERVSLDDLLGMCVLLERHENDQHKEYAELARREGHEDIARIFQDLAEGEKFYYDRMTKRSQEVKE